jgi:hypothetical protein
VLLLTRTHITPDEAAASTALPEAFELAAVLGVFNQSARGEGPLDQKKTVLTPLASSA